MWTCAEAVPGTAGKPPARHLWNGDGSSPAPFAIPRLQRSPLLRSSFLLIERRSLRTFSQADFCASTKAAHEKYEGTVIKKIKKFARRALTNDVRRANLY